MIYEQVNVNAMATVLTMILGTEGYRAAYSMYKLLDEAETQGFQRGYAQGNEEGYTYGLEMGRADVILHEKEFRAGWQYGFTAGKAETQALHAAMFGTGVSYEALTADDDEVIALPDYSDSTAVGDDEFAARAAAYDLDDIEIVGGDDFDDLEAAANDAALDAHLVDEDFDDDAQWRSNNYR